MEIVRVDSRGRIAIPKHIRRALGIEEGSLLKLEVVNGKIVLEPLESVADKYYGVFRIEKWPRDIDEFLNEVLARWLREST